MTVIETTIESGILKSASNMNGKKWLQYSISIWDDIKKSKEELKLKHPAMFPSMLCERLIEIYSKKGDLILDPFAGSGSTLIAATAKERKSIGLELSQDFIQLYETRLKQVDFFEENGGNVALMVKADARNLTRFVNSDSVTLSITSPPYWDILNQPRSADGKKVRNYGNNEGDLGNIRDYQKFLSALSDIFEKVFAVTKSNGFCCVILMDIRKGNKLYPFHMDTINFMRTIGWELDDIIIWDRKREYNNLRPLGYPHVFRVNKVHEYILIFQKRVEITGKHESKIRKDRKQGIR